MHPKLVAIKVNGCHPIPVILRARMLAGLMSSSAVGIAVPLVGAGGAATCRVPCARVAWSVAGLVAADEQAGDLVVLQGEVEGEDERVGQAGELAATLAAQRLDPAGVAGGVFADELFADSCGEATIFIPCTQAVRAMGRVVPVVVPSADLAIIVHPGSPKDIDRAYGALGAYVTRYALAVNGPLREYYLVGPTDTDDETLWRTEVGWPIFAT